MKALRSPLGIAVAIAASAFGATAAHAGIAGPAATCEARTLPEILCASSASVDSIRWQPVDDAVLARQTGKFAGPAMIDGMVLNVVSQWRLPNGASASAHGSLSVTANANQSLAVSVATSAQVSDAMRHHDKSAPPGGGASPSASATGGQNLGVNGVSQITQVAGDGNVGMNSAVIDFNGQGTQPLAGSSSPSASATNAAGTIKAGIAFGGNGLALALQTPAGVATQTVVPGSGAQPGTIAQLLQIAGNAQIVSNQLQLSLRTRPMSSALLRQLGTLQALRDAASTRR